MWLSRVSVLAVVVAALSCGSSQPTARKPAWVAPAILAQVPADSPYVFATLQPLEDKLRRRMFGAASRSLDELVKTTSGLTPDERANLGPAMRAVLALAEDLRGKDLTTWWRELGFDPSGRFVVYGLSVWPVARIEIADPARLRAVIERALTAAGVKPTRATLAGRAYWSLGTDKVTAIAAVLDREAVVALVPTPALATALPLILGTQQPAHPIGSTTTVTDLLARNHFIDLMIGYLDLRSVLAVMTGPTPTPLDAPLRAQAGPIAPACRADLERLVSALPRIAFGYRRFDEAGFDGRIVFETLPGVTSALKRVRASVPEVAVPVAGHPLFAMGVAVKPDELIAALRSLTGELHAHPFTCPWFDGVNRASTELAGKLASPLPPMLRGVRGFAMMVDNLTIQPFDVEGHVLIASDHAPDLLSSLTAMVPGMPSLPVKPDGRPVEIPTQQLHLPVRSAHIAMASDRIVIAAGPASAQRATAHLASRAPASSPLGLMAFDMPRLQALLAAIGSKDTARLDYVGDMGMSFDVDDDGLGFAVWGTWQDPAAPAAIAK